MIPRRIHFCWFSGDSLPQKVEECIASWRKFLPDYEIVLWDMAHLREEFGTDIDSFPCWLREALIARKWAFAADFLRVYAVYNYGGIYLDADCMVHASLDRYLSDRMFIGREDSPRVTHFFYVEVWLTSHCFGAEKGHPFLRKNLDYYKDRHFLMCDAPELDNSLRYDMRLLPEIQARIAMSFGYDISAYAEHLQCIDEGVKIYPSSVFGLSGLKVIPTASLCVSHLCLGGWIDERRPHTSLALNWHFKIRWRLLKLLRKLAPRFQFVLFEYT